MNLTKQVIVLIFTLIALSVATIYILTYPAINEKFDLSGNSIANVGTTLSGIITPLFTFISIILLYITIVKQADANKQQKCKNDADLVFSLIAQLQLDLDRLVSREDTGPTNNRVERIKTGYEALFSYLKGFNLNTYPHLLNTFVQISPEIIQFVNAFELILNRIRISEFDSQTQRLFYEKVSILYRGFFQAPFKLFVQNANELEGEIPIEIVHIRAFVTRLDAISAKY